MPATQASRAFRSRFVGTDAVVEQLHAMYGGGTSYNPGPSAELAHAGLGDAHAMTNHTRINASFSGVVRGYLQPVILRTRSGRLEMLAPGDGRPTRSDEPALYPVDVDIPFAVDHVDMDIVQLSRRILGDAARDVAPDAGAPRLDRVSGLRQPYADAWWGALEQVRRVYASDELYDNFLIRESALNHLGAVTVIAFALVEAPADRVTRAGRLVRKAERYIDDNLDQPLTAAGIASACGTSIRALQLAFRAERDTTPTTHLRRQRLRRTRDALIAADPAVVTVNQIALQHGFTHPGRFAGAYLTAYGEHPRTTLAR